jgi:hypothetical protein
MAMRVTKIVIISALVLGAALYAGKIIGNGSPQYAGKIIGNG